MGDGIVAYTYILQCADGTYYTGWTADLAGRLVAHNKGIGARYTRGRRPVSLVYAEYQQTPSAAAKREYAIKQLSRPEKARLISAGTLPEVVEEAKEEQAAVLQAVNEDKGR
jgi:putative endonuclease